MPDLDTFRAVDMSIFTPRSTAVVLRDTTLKPVTGEDLVDTDGRCAGAPATPEAVEEPTAQQAGVPQLVGGGIGLDMTECEVVRRAGPPEKIDFGTNDRTERTLVLTYIRGPRPGIYGFTAGRLTSIERAPEPPPQPKPARPQKKPPQKRTAT